MAEIEHIEIFHLSLHGFCARVDEGGKREPAIEISRMGFRREQVPDQRRACELFGIRSFEKPCGIGEGVFHALLKFLIIGGSCREGCPEGCSKRTGKPVEGSSRRNGKQFRLCPEALAFPQITGHCDIQETFKKNVEAGSAVAVRFDTGSGQGGGAGQTGGFRRHRSARPGA
jgi:hypothetical protein